MKTAVILFNLGGPDKLESVKPFLFNLFKDKAILTVPAFIRYPLALLISTTREKEAKHIYSNLGGGSPLLPNTMAQAAELQKKLGDDFKVFAVMRYWHPFAKDVVLQVKDYAPDKIVYLPLYPQYSTTTTKSSFEDFDKHYFGKHVSPAPIRIMDYDTLPGLISAHVKLIKPVYDDVMQKAAAVNNNKPPRILFSAHGLPQKIIDAGDPYQQQVFDTCHAVVAALGIPELDWKTTFQSRVGPLKWIEPYTDEEIEKAGEEKVPLVIVPIAFVSEHSETLYEIEIQYRELAASCGVPAFGRVPAVGTHPDFIDGLADLVKTELANEAAQVS